MTREKAFTKLLKDSRYEESLFMTFGSDIDKLGPDCIDIRECDIEKMRDGEFKAIYM